MGSNKSNSAMVVVVAALVVILGIGAAAFALLQGDTDDKGDQQATSKTAEHSTPTTSTKNDKTANLPTIIFTDDGFTQSTYTFPAGTDVRVENKSSMDMQFSSGDHPTHHLHPELNLPVLGAGESATFTPPGKGSFSFHDHINDQFAGTLVIQ